MPAEHDLSRLAAFVEHRLDPEERRAVIAHAADCAECRTVLASLARGAVASTTMPETPRQWARWAVWMPVAASVVIGVGAGWLVLSSRQEGRDAPPSAPTAPVVDSPAPGQPIPPVAGPPAPPGPRAPAATDPAVTRRGGSRTIDGKRFRLEAGAWIDEAYDPFALLPEVAVRTAVERDDLLDKIPDLEPFAALGSNVTVVHQGTVYRIDLPR